MHPRVIGRNQESRMLKRQTFAKTLLIVCAALSASLAAARSDQAASNQAPERFTAFAIDPNNPGPAGTANVDITITRWTPDAERERLTNILLEQGAAKMLAALKALPRLGSIRTTGTIGWELRYARRTELPDGGLRIELITDRPIGTFEAADQSRSLEYPFTTIDIRLNAKGEGEGKLYVATRIAADKGTKVIVMENYSIAPVQLTAVKRLK
jgi:hypothetical protein